MGPTERLEQFEIARVARRCDSDPSGLENMSDDEYDDLLAWACGYVEDMTLMGRRCGGVS